MNAECEVTNLHNCICYPFNDPSCPVHYCQCDELGVRCYKCWLINDRLPDPTPEVYTKMYVELCNLSQKLLTDVVNKL